MYIYDRNEPSRVWLHLHGLGTDVQGRKVEFLREFFKKSVPYSFFGMDMEYEKHTTSLTLDLLEVLLAGLSRKHESVTIGASSHGAYVALNYVKRKPLYNLKRLVLLAPSYNTLTLMIQTFGKERLKHWLEGKASLTIREEDRELTFRKDWAVDVIRNDYEIIKDGRVDFPKN
ncbi:MAG: alpha/beta hydrolase, partial [Aquificae bacterium]|nr:alpha/beta hydrolase [Aquificota bacterium]